MTNQYVWLQSSLEKYQFNTEAARKLCEEFKSIKISADMQPNNEAMDKLINCYNRFLKMFNDNAFSYKYGLQEFEIETNEFDCYFVNTNEGMVPVGYYKKNHPVESVLLLNEKIEKLKNTTVDIKTHIVESLEKDSLEIEKEYEKYKKAKQANYFRASITAISGSLIICYSLFFLKTTNTFEIIKSLGDKQLLIDTITKGMQNMPVFSDAGVGGWLSLAIVHIALIIAVILNFKSIKNEYILAYQKAITERFKKTAQETVKKIHAQFDEILEGDTQELLILTRQGTSATVEKRNIARIIKKINKNLNIAKEYLKKGYAKIIGLKNNWLIVSFAIITCFLCFSYTILANPQFKMNFDQKIYGFQLDMERNSLRSKKIIQLTTEECPVYQSRSTNSKVKYTFPIWTEVELIAKKMVGEESWSKIKKITDNKVISGWVPTSNTVAYNKVDYDSFNEIKIVSATASSYLIGQNTEYIPELAYDWNRQTSWQDGNEYSTGEGEYITLEFEEPTLVNMIQVFPGNAKREDLYWKNERIKKAKLKFSNGLSVTYEFDDSYNEEFQTIWLNKPVETNFITLEVIDTYEGEEYTDLCVSEVHVYASK